MKKIYVISLKYAAGLYKEFSLLNNLFKKFNFKTQFFLSKGYIKNNIDNTNTIIVSNGIGNKGMLLDVILFPSLIYKIYKNIKNEKENFDEIIFLFYNPHPVNFLVQLFLKAIPNSKVVLVLHEPYKTFKDRLEYGFKGFIFFSIVNFLQYLSIKISDKIITMSPYGKELFLKYFPKDNNKLISSNLLISNSLSVEICIEKDRKYFSYIGRVNKGKGICDFIKVVNYVIKNNIDLNFLIITSSNIDEYINKLLPDFENKLKIINKSNISDEEIDDVIARSKGVLILHQTASQSGVLPLCCKYKTPVICRNIQAFSQYYNNNGMLLSKSFDSKELVIACNKINNNFLEYSFNSFKVFEEYFSEDNFIKFYKGLL